MGRNKAIGVAKMAASAIIAVALVIFFNYHPPIEVILIDRVWTFVSSNLGVICKWALIVCGTLTIISSIFMMVIFRADEKITDNNRKDTKT